MVLRFILAFNRAASSNTRSYIHAGDRASVLTALTETLNDTTGETK